MKTARLVLEDGRIFRGRGFGASSEVGGEVVFNTSHFGYQEILTDPSYIGQMVTLTAPLIGNVGVTPLDDEAVAPHAVGLLVRAASPVASNWRAVDSLETYLKKHGVPGMDGLDTRSLVRHLRTVGALRGVLSNEAALSDKALIERARSIPSLEGLDLATRASTSKTYVFAEGLPGAAHVVAVDYGAKRSMFQFLADRGVKLTVVPSSTTAEAILALRPAGVFLTNGPGDPAAVVGAKTTVSSLLGRVPIFGICLGHQILALALGGRTYKMKFGHRGANHPVLEVSRGKVAMTSQNHGFAVDAASLSGKAQVTHLNLNDQTVEGLEAPGLNAFSVQHHPEASPGPQDSLELFDRFVARISL